MAARGGGKQQTARGVTPKSKFGPLFEQVRARYARGPFGRPPRFPLGEAEQWPRAPLPEAQRLGAAVGPLVAQARLWRGFPLPDATALGQAFQGLAQHGMPAWEAQILVMVTESLVRPMRPVELAVERLLPRFFAEQTDRGRMAELAQATAQRAFRWLWEEKTREVGDGWLLAATRRPLWVRGRPGFHAPKVAGAAVAERLELEGTARDAAVLAAAGLVSVLTGHPVLPKTIAYWRQVFRGVSVRQGEERISLPRYFAYPLTRLGEAEQDTINRRAILNQLTPTAFLETWALPIATGADLASLFWRQGPTKRAACQLCDTEEMPLETLYEHLTQTHGIPGTAITLPERRSIPRFASSWYANELRHEDGHTILAKWRNGPPFPGGNRRGPSGADPG